MNEGLPDQAHLCKKIVVIDRPSEKLIDTTLCYGDSCYSGGKWHSASGVYYDTIPLSSGCDSVVVSSCDSQMWFPNVFTPNADGLNDIFHAVGQGVSTFSMLIFNRWGEQVFKTDNFDHGWDGRFREAYCPDGVYFYIAT